MNKNVLTWFGNGLKYMLALSIWEYLGISTGWHIGTDPDPRIRTTDLRIQIRIHILLFSSVPIKMSTQNKFLSKLFCLLFLEGTFKSVFKNEKS